MSDADLKPPRRWTRRPLFSPDQMLTAQQLNTLIDGQREHGERLMRALYGPGVLFGFAVGLSDPGRLPGNPPVDANLGPKGSTRLEISCGMALDRHGRLLHWPEGSLPYCEIVTETGCAGTFTLSAHYAERRSAHGGCGPCADKPEWIEEGVVFTLTLGCSDWDRACPAPTDGACVSWDEFICSRTGSGSGKLPPQPDLQTACAATPELCRIECSDEYYDAAAGIPIACVTIANLAGGGCRPVWGFSGVSKACEVRPYVYRTPLLYELIGGCQDNLARVTALSWQDWVDSSKQVPWREFEAKFLRSGDLWFEFSRAIAVATVHPGSVFLTTTYRDPESDYVLVRRIPARLQPTNPQDDHATRFEFVLHPNWVDNAVKQSPSTLRQGGRIELTIRGQMLRDRCGNMLDALPISYDPKTPRQHRPGDDFISTFRLEKAPNPPPRAPRRPSTRPIPESYEDY
ncbi:MAG: hypothetical protein QOG84_320 [Sphingomonadales bacterium]|jgi:hypothetical protein|nr:hypothetical protein [Sphingomonadales bacterium]